MQEENKNKRKLRKLKKTNINKENKDKLYALVFQKTKPKQSRTKTLKQNK
jgi:hypothetical protein